MSDKSRFRRYGMYAGSAIILLVLSWLGRQFWLHSQLIISPETTGITAPLTAEGLPDYLAAENENASHGVSAESNAMTLFAEISESSGAWRDGVSEIRRESTARQNAPIRFVSQNEFSQASSARFLLSSDQLRDRLYDQISLALKKPWSEADFPELHAWVEVNRPVIPVLIEASQQPHCYLPHMQAGDGTPDKHWKSVIQSYREGCKLLLVTAMESYRDNPRSAGQNISAVTRLSRISQNIPSIGMVLKPALEVSALETVTVLLVLDENVPFLDEWVQIWKELPADVALHDYANRQFRWTILDALIREEREKRTRWPKINQLLIDRNREIDQCVELIMIEPYSKRNSMYLSMQSQRSQAKVSTTTIDTWYQLRMNDDRTSIRRRLLEIHIALARYRRKYHSWPGELRDLIPEFVRELPLDLYSGKSDWIFRRQPQGYLLYSLGPDRSDQWIHFSPNRASDDIGLILPVSNHEPKSP